MNDAGHEDSLKKLAEELSLSKKSFRSYPQQLKYDSTKQGEEILRQLTVMRNGLNETMNKLSAVVKTVLDRIGNVWGRVLPMLDHFNDAGYMSWLVGLVSCTSTLVVTLFLLIPVSCTCCNIESLAGICFIMAACVLSVFSIFLGMFSIFEVLVGSHGEVFVCRTLFESPEFTIVGKLFDNPGIIYSHPPVNGLFAEMLQSNGKSFSNTSLSKALGDCECDKSTYKTFQLENLLDLTNSLNYENYLDISQSISAIQAKNSPFMSFTKRIMLMLDGLTYGARGNLTSYRAELTEVSPEKEMISFIDQMQRVSLQIQDSSIASRMASIAMSARSIQSEILQPLEKLKNDIIFELMTLELHIDPWTERAMETEKSFSHAQRYLDDFSVEICANYSESFRNRLRSNLAIFRNETLANVHNQFGCRPLFETFNGLRWLICSHIVEPINGEVERGSWGGGSELEMLKA